MQKKLIILFAKRKISIVMVNNAFKSGHSVQLVQEEAWLPYHKLTPHKFRAISVPVRDCANLNFSQILNIKITHAKFYDTLFTF
jgi:hypothetical protein